MKPLLSLTTFIGCVTCVVTLACGRPGEAPSPAAAAKPARGAIADVPAVAPTGCIELEGELGGRRTTLEGRLFIDNAYEHPTRGKTHPLVLRLDTPRCAVGIDDTQVSEIHLASGEGIALRPLVGKHVRVSGDPFAAHTAWHARPIVFMTITATAN